MSAPPPQVEYGGDEIAALVLDPGFSVTRAGFAGEDTPKSFISTHYAVNAEKQLLFDDNSIHNPLPNLSIHNPFSSDGIVEDWDTAIKLWEYAITSRLTGPKQTHPSKNGLNDKPANGEDTDMDDVDEMEKPMEEFPLLMSEPNWNPQKHREKYLENAMENWGCPAFWLGRSGILAAFASGKPSALVIDVGASNSSVTPVNDGLALKKGIQHSHLAGNFISQQLRLQFAQSQPPVPLTPHYLISSKTPVEAGQPAKATFRSFSTLPDSSFRRLEEERVLTEFKESCVQVWNPARNGNQSLAHSTEFLRATEPPRPFEMPDGWNNVFGIERYKVAEALFDAKIALTGEGSPSTPNQNETIPGLVSSSLSAVDADVKAQLLNNIVVTGGTSLIQGMTDRINLDLMGAYAGTKVRVNAPGNVIERRSAAWIGGSILASLGSFHQMWISKKEYDEHGPGIVEKRCK